MEKPKIILESLEAYDGGKSNGYYDPATNEIHMLRGSDLELRTRIHEQTHAARSETVTFQFAQLQQSPALRKFLWASTILLAIYGVAIHTLLSMVPFFFLAALFTFTMLCVAYEEYRADLAVIQNLKELKKLNLNGGENQK